MNPRDFQPLIAEAERQAAQTRVGLAEACTLSISVLCAWATVLPALAFILIALFLTGVRDLELALFISGSVLLGAAVPLLRRPATGGVLEQACIPVLLSGMIMFGIAMAEQGKSMGVLLQVAMGLAVWAVVPRRSIRILCGMWATTALLIFAHVNRFQYDHAGAQWMQWLLPLALVVGMTVWRMWYWRGWTQVRGAHMPQGVDQLLSGASLALLAYLWLYVAPRWLSGFDVLGGLFAGFDFGGVPGMRIPPLVCALAAVLCLQLHWPELRTWTNVPALGALVALTWIAPVAGYASLIMAVALVERRWAAALGAAAVMAAALVNIYADLDLTLRQSAAILLAVSAVLAACGWAQWRALPRRPGGHSAGRTFRLKEMPAHAPGPEPETEAKADPGAEDRPTLQPAPERRHWKRGAVAGSALAALLLSGFAAYQNESAISTGQTLFVPLAPVDPRSLMQGDYMSLRFDLPSRDWSPSSYREEPEAPPIVAQRQPDGVARLLRFHAQGTPLGAGEILLQTRVKDGALILGTDAFFFAEGEARRYEGAKFGEFKLAKDGKIHLVGLRGENLKPL